MMNILKSRKARWTLAGLIASVLASFVGSKLGLTPEEIQTAVFAIVTAAVGMVLGIAHEDNGAKSNPSQLSNRSNKINQFPPMVLALTILLGMVACGPRETTLDREDVANVTVCLWYQDGAPVNLGELVQLNDGQEVFAVSGDRLVEFADPETGEFVRQIKWGALTTRTDPVLGDNCRIVIDGNQYVEGVVVTPCSGQFEHRGELYNIDRANDITIGNDPDGYCGIGHVPDCAFQPVALWGPVMDVAQCCTLTGAGDQAICGCQNVVCDLGTICSCEDLL